MMYVEVIGRILKTVYAV